MYCAFQDFENLYLVMDLLTGGDLSDINTAIQAIKDELTSGNGAELTSTLIDKHETLLAAFKTLRGYAGDPEAPVALDVNGVSVTTIQNIIDQLETLISHLDGKIFWRWYSNTMLSWPENNLIYIFSELFSGQTCCTSYVRFPIGFIIHKK